MVTRETLQTFAHEAGLAEPSIVLSPLGAPVWNAVTLEPERPLYPASMIKTPLVAAAMTDVEAGRIRLDDRVEVTQANMTVNDAPSPLRPGYYATVHELCDLAISRSDNVATNMLYDVVGRERATTIVRERFGLERTAFYRKLSGSEPLIVDPGWDGTHRNTHPASDAARMFDLIANDRVPYADEIKASLTRQYWNAKLTKGLREGDRYLHKTGDTDDVAHDGGILLTAQGREYVIVVYTALPSSDANDTRFGAFMKHLREHL